jgi:hypothetical protein
MTILNLGRLGDNINLLPVAYANKGTTFVTSEKYSSIFEGTSYCQTKKYSGDPVELQHCINLCQGLPDLRVAQVFMHPKETKQEKNYALESYRLGRFRDQWRKFPYVFDRRNPEREHKLLNQIFPKVYDIQPFIAVATHGVSSPFLHGKKLISGLHSRFPEYKIVDLSTIQAEKPFDLLGVLDAASCLVTIDTLHLWLANAAKCPTIALINEGWRGSPPPVTATSTFRYSQFQIDQICDEVEKTLLPTGEIWAIVDRFGQEKRHREAFKSQKQAFDHMLTAENVRTAQEIGDSRPLPMLKEMLAKALKFTKGRDVIVWTNDDVQIQDLHPVVSHCRRFGAVGVRRDPAHIGRELFAFRWDWLADRIYNFPDCAVASPWFDLAVAAWIRRQFGWVSTMDNLIEDRYPAEIPNEKILHHPDHPSSWTGSMERPASKWNERIFKMLLT